MTGTFKDRLKALMKGERPYSFAGKIGIQRGLFQYYWQKGGIPTSENLLKIQRYTGCSLDWLLTGHIPTLKGQLTDIRFTQPASADKGLRQKRFTDCANKLMKLYSRLPNEKLKAIESVIEAFGK